jgi:hypothetical protein
MSARNPVEARRATRGRVGANDNGEPPEPPEVAAARRLARQGEIWWHLVSWGVCSGCAAEIGIVQTEAEEYGLRSIIPRRLRTRRRVRGCSHRSLHGQTCEDSAEIAFWSLPKPGESGTT